MDLIVQIMNGGRLDEFVNEVKRTQFVSQLQHLLNEKDNTGCSALHYASREGHIRSLESLIRYGACINLKNNNNESALHFAARYGRYNTVRQLLDSEKGTFIINESDGEGLTPLHIVSILRNLLYKVYRTNLARIFGRHHNKDTHVSCSYFLIVAHYCIVIITDEHHFT